MNETADRRREESSFDTRIVTAGLDDLEALSHRDDFSPLLRPHIEAYIPIVGVFPEEEFSQKIQDLTHTRYLIEPSDEKPHAESIARLVATRGAAVLSDLKSNPTEVIIKASALEYTEPFEVMMILGEELGHAAHRPATITPVDALDMALTTHTVAYNGIAQAPQGSILKSATHISEFGFMLEFLKNDRVLILAPPYYVILEEMRAQLIEAYISGHYVAMKTGKPFHRAIRQAAQLYGKIDNLGNTREKVAYIYQMGEHIGWDETMELCVNGSANDFVALLNGQKRHNRRLFQIFDSFLDYESRDLVNRVDI